MKHKKGKNGTFTKIIHSTSGAFFAQPCIIPSHISPLPTEATFHLASELRTSRERLARVVAAPAITESTDQKWWYDLPLNDV